MNGVLEIPYATSLTSCIAIPCARIARENGTHAEAELRLCLKISSSGLR